MLPLKLIYFGSEENQTEINESEGIIINETVDEDADGDILVNETANEGEEGDILVNQNQNESEDDEENRVNASKVMVEDEEGNIVSCADKLGKICLVDKEVCNGKTIVADNICCLGECVLKKEADNKIQVCISRAMPGEKLVLDL